MSSLFSIQASDVCFQRLIHFVHTAHVSSLPWVYRGGHGNAPQCASTGNINAPFRLAPLSGTGSASWSTHTKSYWWLLLWWFMITGHQIPVVFPSPSRGTLVCSRDHKLGVAFLYIAHRARCIIVVEAFTKEVDVKTGSIHTLYHRYTMILERRFYIVRNLGPRWHKGSWLHCLLVRSVLRPCDLFYKEHKGSTIWKVMGEGGGNFCLER